MGENNRMKSKTYGLEFRDRTRAPVISENKVRTLDGDRPSETTFLPFNQQYLTFWDFLIINTQ